MQLLPSVAIIGLAVGVVHLAVIRVRRHLRKLRSFDIVEVPSVMSEHESLTLPLVASATLFGLYLAVKVLGPHLINLLLSVYLTGVGVLGLLHALRGFISTRPLRAVCGVISLVVGLTYLVTGQWLASNALALGIAITAVELAPLKSFRAAAGLLLGLFVYDIFWVFGTDVMLTVAKNIDGPIKVLIPRHGLDTSSMMLLGLGDIVLPGWFIAMMIRFEASKGHQVSYYKPVIIVYIASLMLTHVAVAVSGSGQPALLYIVPALLSGSLWIAARNGQFSELIKYDDEKELKKIFEAAKQKVPEKAEVAERRAARILSLRESLEECFLYLVGFEENEHEKMD